MIEVPRQSEPPTVTGQYLAVIAGTPLPLVLAWTGDRWQRGATMIARVSHWAGPVTIERRKATDD